MIYRNIRNYAETEDAREFFSFLFIGKVIERLSKYEKYEEVLKEFEQTKEKNLSDTEEIDYLIDLLILDNDFNDIEIIEDYLEFEEGIFIVIGINNKEIRVIEVLK